MDHRRRVSNDLMHEITLKNLSLSLPHACNISSYHCCVRELCSLWQQKQNYSAHFLSFNYSPWSFHYIEHTMTKFVSLECNGIPLFFMAEPPFTFSVCLGQLKHFFRHLKSKSLKKLVPLREFKTKLGQKIMDSRYISTMFLCIQPTVTIARGYKEIKKKANWKFERKLNPQKSSFSTRIIDRQKRFLNTGHLTNVSQAFYLNYCIFFVTQNLKKYIPSDWIIVIIIYIRP